MLPSVPSGNEPTVPEHDEMLERWNAFVRETDARREEQGAVEPADDAGVDEHADGEPAP